MGTHWELEWNMLGINGKWETILPCQEKNLTQFCNTFLVGAKRKERLDIIIVIKRE